MAALTSNVATHLFAVADAAVVLTPRHSGAAGRGIDRLPLQARKQPLTPRQPPPRVYLRLELRLRIFASRLAGRDENFQLANRAALPVLSLLEQR